MISIFIDGRIGDFFAIDSLLCLEQKEQVSSVYYFESETKPYSDFIKSLFSFCFPNMENFFIIKYSNRKEEEKLIKEIDENLNFSLDFTIPNIVYHNPLPAIYQHSTFLESSLTNVESNLPNDFAFIHSRSQGEGRSFTKIEWDYIIRLLECRGLKGLVFGTCEEPLLPHCCTSMIGDTTLFDSIEILKKAKMFIGISSCFAILASKIFSEDDLRIRTTNENVYFNHLGSIFYAPHKRIGDAFSFLHLNSLYGVPLL